MELKGSSIVGRKLHKPSMKNESGMDIILNQTPILCGCEEHKPAVMRVHSKDTLLGPTPQKNYTTHHTIGTKTNAY
eukprot:scaffold109768_cov84-Attheya_sp.AAC.1